MVVRFTGVMLLVGFLIACNNAVRDLKSLAEQGNADAQFSLGLEYYSGDNRQQDYAEALRWFQFAANQKHIRAQYLLGYMYETGKGTSRGSDFIEAARWYGFAAEQGHTGARDGLERITHNKAQLQSPNNNRTYERMGVTEFRTRAVFPDTTFVVALLALDCPELDDGQTNLLTEIVRTELFRTGVFDLMERDKMTSMLDEVGFAYSACTSTQCVIEAGRILSVQHMVAGSVGRIGNTYVINLRAFDVETGRTVATAGKNCRDCAIDDMVETAIPEAVEELAVTITRSGS